MMERIAIEVRGCPAPKGSGRAMNIGGKARFIASGSTANQRALKSWDAALREAAARAVGAVAAPPFVARPLRVTMVFRLRRPAGHYGKAGQLKATAPTWPITKPDGSKLLRATEDTLTGIVWDDDSRIVEWFIRKAYATPGQEGARLLIEPVGPP